MTVVTNRLHSAQKVWVIRPSGIGSPRTGGQCGDSRRPAVLLIHGWPANQFIGLPTTPSIYGGLIRNFVSNGNIVVFPTYDWSTVVDFTPPIDTASLVRNMNLVAATVADGFQQVVDTSVRIDKSHLGVLGHSLGGGVATTSMNMIVGARPSWGASSRWLALVAATDAFFHCNNVPDPFAPPDPATFDYDAECVDLATPPDNTQMLYITPMGDSPDIHISMWRLYEDMPLPIDRKWGVILQNDCSHSQGLGTCLNMSGAMAASQACPQKPDTAKECGAGHLLPTKFSDRGGTRFYNHLNFYGLYRNLQALSDCARSSASPSCDVDRTFMGVWGDGKAATAAEEYP